MPRRTIVRFHLEVGPGAQGKGRGGEGRAEQEGLQWCHTVTYPARPYTRSYWTEVKNRRGTNIYLFVCLFNKNEIYSASAQISRISQSRSLVYFTISCLTRLGSFGCLRIIWPHIWLCLPQIKPDPSILPHNLSTWLLGVIFWFEHIFKGRGKHTKHMWIPHSP